MACGNSTGSKKWRRQKRLPPILSLCIASIMPGAQLTTAGVRPNQAHYALVRLEQACNGEFLLITQNVDNLHQRAGSSNLIPMHGQLTQARCLKSGEVSAIDGVLDADTRCTCCEPPAAMRPDIVWFGEMPLQMNRIEQALSRAQLFIAIGTSGQVYPAAGFAAMAAEYGADTVELNLEPTGGAFNRGFYGPASRVVPDFVNRLLGESDVS